MNKDFGEEILGTTQFYVVPPSQRTVVGRSWRGDYCNLSNIAVISDVISIKL
jgi:hypothetical protein